MGLHLTLLIGSVTLNKTTLNETIFTIDWVIRTRVKFLHHLINVIIKWSWSKQRCSRTCCITLSNSNSATFKLPEGWLVGWFLKSMCCKFSDGKEIIKGYTSNKGRERANYMTSLPELSQRMPLQLL